MKTKLWLSLMVLLAAVLVFTACSSDSDNQEEVYTFTVDTQGGQIQVPDGGPTLDIPAGSLTEEVEITITKSKNVGTLSAGDVSDPFQDANGGSLTYFDSTGNEVAVEDVDVEEVSDVYEFGPEGLVFEQPVTVTISYFTDRVQEGANLHFFWTKLNDKSVFEEIEDATFASGTATAAVEHFSDGKVIITIPKADGDVEEEQEEQPLDWPTELTISPARDAEDVGLVTPIIIEASEALDPDTLNFEFSDGTSSVEGWYKFGKDNMAFYFFPTNILATDQTFTATLTFDGVEYESSFTTVGDAGQNTLAGTTATGTDSLVSFLFDMSSVFEPAEYEESILGAKNIVKYLFAPVFVDDTAGETVYGMGEANTLAGDDKPLVLNYGALGFHLDVQTEGSYFLFSKPVSFLYREAEIEANNVFFGGKVVEGTGGNPEIVDGFAGIFMEDCSDLTVAFPQVAFAVILSQICDSDSGNMFLASDFSGSYNELSETGFEVTTTAEYIEFTASSPLWTDWVGVNKYHANLTILDGTTTVFDSDDAADSMSITDMGAADGTDYYNFTKIRFDLPTALSAGNYDLRLIFGLEGVDHSFTIGD